MDGQGAGGLLYRNEKVRDLAILKIVKEYPQHVAVHLKAYPRWRAMRAGQDQASIWIRDELLPQHGSEYDR